MTASAMATQYREIVRKMRNAISPILDEYGLEVKERLDSDYVDIGNVSIEAHSESYGIVKKSKTQSGFIIDIETIFKDL